MLMHRRARLAAAFLSCVLGAFSFLLSPHIAPRNHLQLLQPLNVLNNVDVKERNIDSKTNVPNVVVVGGGIGGLSVASRIAASRSCEIILLEKNKFLGGRMGSFEHVVRGVGRFRHERGPSLLLLPHVYREAIKDCSGQDAEDYGLHMTQCIPAYQVVFDDGDVVNLGFPRRRDELPGMAEQLSRETMNRFEKHGAEKWDRYMRACRAFLDCGLPNFIEEKVDLLSFPAFLIEALMDWGRGWPLKPHGEVLDGFFESNKMKAMASFQDLYVGLVPFKNDKLFAGGVMKSTAPAVFGLLAAIELHPYGDKSGVFAPVGGFEAVTKAFTQLANELFVKIRTNSTVTRVCPDGVYVEDSTSPAGETLIRADAVIVNADLPYAKSSLLTKTRPIEQDNTTKSVSIYDWNDSYDFSSGVIAFHWSISKKLDDLNTHNVFLVASTKDRMERSWRVLQSQNDAFDFDSFNFYVHRASKTDPTAAPDGCDSLLVLVPCHTLNRDSKCASLSREEALREYKKQVQPERIKKVRSAVLSRMAVVDSLSDLESFIVDETVDTPVSYADDYNLAAGTPFALSHGFGQLSITRPGPRSSGIPNVFYCGASSRPGNGVPLVLIGAKKAAEEVKSYLDRHLHDVSD